MAGGASRRGRRGSGPAPRPAVSRWSTDPWRRAGRDAFPRSNAGPAGLQAFEAGGYDHLVEAPRAARTRPARAGGRQWPSPPSPQHRTARHRDGSTTLAGPGTIPLGWLLRTIASASAQSCSVSVRGYRRTLCTSTRRKANTNALSCQALPFELFVTLEHEVGAALPPRIGGAPASLGNPPLSASERSPGGVHRVRSSTQTNVARTGARARPRWIRPGGPAHPRAAPRHCAQRQVAPSPPGSRRRSHASAPAQARREHATAGPLARSGERHQAVRAAPGASTAQPPNDDADRDRRGRGARPPRVDLSRARSPHTTGADRRSTCPRAPRGPFEAPRYPLPRRKGPHLEMRPGRG